MVHPRENVVNTRRDRTARREFLSWLTAAMAGGVVAGYGTLIAMSGRYLCLYPAGMAAKAWVFVTELKGMAHAELPFTTAPCPPPIAYSILHTAY